SVLVSAAPHGRGAWKPIHCSSVDRGKSGRERPRSSRAYAFALRRAWRLSRYGSAPYFERRRSEYSRRTRPHACDVGAGGRFPEHSEFLASGGDLHKRAGHSGQYVAASVRGSTSAENDAGHFCAAAGYGNREQRGIHTSDGRLIFTERGGSSRAGHTGRGQEPSKCEGIFSSAPGCCQRQQGSRGTVARRRGPGRESKECPELH